MPYFNWNLIGKIKELKQKGVDLSEQHCIGHSLYLFKLGVLGFKLYNCPMWRNVIV